MSPWFTAPPGKQIYRHPQADGKPTLGMWEIDPVYGKHSKVRPGVRPRGAKWRAVRVSNCR